MPIDYVRRLTGNERTAQANRHLGIALAFVAGATNAGGFLAVRQYTSHMTGIVSAMADNVGLGAYDLVLGGVGALLSFLLGATCSTVIVNYARRRRMQSEFALVLLLEASLLICFGILGTQLAKIEGLFVPVTVIVLCYIMGLQNALITKLSHAEIRTTHITGIVTDVGIELGRLIYWNRSKKAGQTTVVANRARLGVLALLGVAFFVGGVAGAVGFKHLGYSATLPLALLLIVLAGVPAIDDFKLLLRR